MDKKYIEKLKDQLSIDGWNGSIEKLDTIITTIEKEINIERFLFLAKLKMTIKTKDSNILDKIFEDFKDEVIKSSSLFKHYSYNESNIRITFFDSDGDDFIEYVFHSMDDYYTNNKPYVRKGSRDNYIFEDLVIKNGILTHVQQLKN